jgi:alpha-glucuronidase
MKFSSLFRLSILLLAGCAPLDSSDKSASPDSQKPYPLPHTVPDEDGSQLWLRFPLLPASERLAQYRQAFTHVVALSDSPTAALAKVELVRGIGGLTGKNVGSSADMRGAGSVLIGTARAPQIARLPLRTDLSRLGNEGYAVERVVVDGRPLIAVAANTDIGTLYGTYALLRHLQSHLPVDDLLLSSVPAIQLRVLNHWDNLDRSVERGYAGKSLWDWDALPGEISPRYLDYARANASIGINGTVLTNVNADAQVLTAPYLAKVKALADVFRPYGIRVYLTARFSAPMEIGGLDTADPLDTRVRQWWAGKTDEVYRLIPDFGGFVVKANSEGQPGPQDYNRTHADGANMLADALAPHGGIVMWRAFVYASSATTDRIRQAYGEFKPLDGQFKGNVLVQTKNGPLDFQPREPFHPLFGAMPKTPLVLELQITKEYLGMDTHLAYLGPWYQETLQADTHAKGPGSTVARVIDGSLHGHTISAIAGVANIGDDVNWTGSHFNQANWYVFGRMAWNPDLSAQAVAQEWVRQTFSNEPRLVTPVVDMMMQSHEALVNYMTPLGLVHIMGNDHHYGPGAWLNSLERPEWNPVYYHKADRQQIGFDRTASGSDAAAQYPEPVRRLFASRATVPDEFLLFFHRVAWDERLKSGRTLWQELVHRYSAGVDAVQAMRNTWAEVQPYIDRRRFVEVADFLQIQHYEARWWRDASLSYFSSVNGRAIPEGYAKPRLSFDEYRKIDCPADVEKPRCPQLYRGDPSPVLPAGAP